MPDTMQMLHEYLDSECYQPSIYHIGPEWSHCSESYCLEKTQLGHEAFSVERGQKSSIYFIEQEERIACRKFIELLGQDAWAKGHCISITSNPTEIEETFRILESYCIRAVRNDIPNFARVGDTRYRLFVFGKDVRTVKQLVASGTLRPLEKL